MTYQEQQAIDKYWAAGTRDEERAAYADLMSLGLVDPETGFADFWENFDPEGRSDG